MATKRKGILRRIGDGISKLMRQPLSDESNEVPSSKSVGQAKAAMGGKKTSTTRKARKGSRKTKKI